MKILQVITLSELGGAQSVVINLANQLCKEHDVIVASGEGDGKMWDMLSPEVVRHQCRYLQRAISPLKDPLALFELIRINAEYKPDVIHLHSSKAGLLGRIAFPSNKIVYTVHGFDSIRVAHRKMLPLEKFMQRFCHSIVGVSRYDYANLLNEGIRRNVSVVYNAITRPESTEYPMHDFFEKYDKTVLAIARLSHQKRHDIFVEISRRLPDYGFIWIGNQEPVDGVPENCFFLGNIPNAGAYCSMADLVCLPSNYEGLPMVILEAMSHGKPVVASDVGGIGEIVRNGENGYVVQNDAECFAERIKEILEDEEKMSVMGEASRAMYVKELTVDKMVSGYMNIYNQIIRR